ncbi:MAG TPA: RDD family protein [Propionibacteriaceae bacterium]|nr:RDD family protein [Propionibacteriaceae bacterium]
MSDQSPTSPDPSDAVPGYTPPSNEPPAYTPPPASDPYAAAPGAYPPPPAADYSTAYPPATTGAAGAVVDWPKRALGGLIDYVAPAIVFGVVGSIIGNAVSSTLGNIIDTVLIAAWWAYLGYLSGTYGITPGRAIAKTKLISEETGQLIGVGQGILRQLGHVLDSLACYIGWLFPLWDAKRQTFADKIVKTVVIDNSADPNAGQIRWS